MSYKHDVFMSYTNGYIRQWVQNIFCPLFEPLVSNRLGRDIDIFIDRKGLSGGDSWPLELHNALAHSRCLVAFWSPKYFNSEWCRKESAVMLYRAQQLGYHSLENPSGLVFPFTVFDSRGERLPDSVKHIHRFDCTEYVLTAGYFPKTRRYLEFEERLREWSKPVAKIITNAPTWNSSWLKQEWLEVMNIRLDSPEYKNFFPGME